MDNTEKVIDFLTQRYGSTGTTARARLLNWLKLAVDELWAADDWYWKTEEVTFAYTAAEGEYTLDVDTESVVDVFDVDGNPMAFVPIRTFNALYRSTEAVAGTPEVWTLDGQNQATGALLLRLWPYPDADGNGKMKRRVRDVELEDSDENRSRIPTTFMHVCVLKVHALVAEHEKQLAEAQAHTADYERALEQLRMDNRKRKGGIR